MKKILFVILIIICSCSNPKELLYNIDYPFSEEIISSNDGYFSFRKPKNFSPIIKSKIITENKTMLLDRDSTSIIVIEELKAPYSVKEIVKENGYELLGKLSFQMKRNSTGDSLFIIKEPMHNTLGKNNICDYEYIKLPDSLHFRICIFEVGYRLYESTAFSLKKNNNIYLDTLFSLQNKIVETISPKN